MGRGDLFNVVTLGKGTKRSVDLPHPESLSSFIKGPNMKYRFKQGVRGIAQLGSPGQGVVLSLFVLAPVFPVR